MQIDLSTIKKVYFIGIGGIGISAIARMMQMEGKDVSGQDMAENKVSESLREVGIKVTIGQSLEEIPKDADLIVYTIAIEVNDPEFFAKIKELSIPLRSYPEMLGIVSKDKYTIAIAGTHGKTTTTGMVAHIMMNSDLDPTVVIGSLITGSKTNFISGESKYFVVESCEYRRSFLNINPNILVITNIEEDHLDYYKDIEDIRNAFHALVMKVPEDGFIICDPKAKNLAEVLEGAKAKIVDVNEYMHKRTLLLPGDHNQFDASLAGSVGQVLGLEESLVDSKLSTFPGTWRRFEYKGDKNGAKFYDDYAHHPTEIQVTIKGAREMFPKEEGYKLTVIFQPHLFSRTKAFLKDFALELSKADFSMILPIYKAREVDDGTVSAQLLVEKIIEAGGNSKSYDTFDEAEKDLINKGFGPKDIILTMGAGEAYQIGENILKI